MKKFSAIENGDKEDFEKYNLKMLDLVKNSHPIAMVIDNNLIFCSI